MFVKSGWCRVTKRCRCPVCGEDSGCVVSADGAVALCMRIPSEKEIECSGVGTCYRHKLDETVVDIRRLPKPKSLTPKKPPRMLVEILAGYAEQTRGSMIGILASSLGVTEASLKALGAVWSGSAWAFPMRDQRGVIVGIRYRGKGAKWSEMGSKSGLFYRLPWRHSGRVYSVEGPTDCAAMLDLGVCVVGRPAAMGCEDWVAAMTVGRELVIIADRDKTRTAPNGAKVNAGLDGAERLKAACAPTAKWVRVIRPPAGCKDVRDWAKRGKLTTDVLDCMIRERA